MADLARIKGNIRKMVAQGAPEADIDQYIAEEGVTIDDVRNFQPPPIAEQPSPEAPAAPADRNFLNVSRDLILGPPPAEPQPYGPVDRPVPMGPMADSNIQYRTELQKQAAAKKINETLSRPMTEGSQSGLLMGFDDELAAAANAPFHAAYDWWKGKGFDVGRAYTALQQQLDAQKQRRREEHPIASLAGEVAGGLALGGLAQKAGATLMGRTVPILSRVAPVATQTGLAALEGGIYGGVQGAGEAKPGERLAGARRGAGAGAAMGFGAQVTGNVIANRLAQRAARTTAQTSDDLATAGRKLYQASEQEGVRYRPQSVSRLRVILRAGADRLNKDLRPLTYGFVDDIQHQLSGKQSISLEVVDDLRKRLGNSMKRAGDDDARTLGQMKSALDDFLDTATPADVTGDATKAVDFLKQGRALWQRHEKTKLVEDLLDLADVNAKGQYTQSGIVNATRRKMKTLYEQIKKGKQKGWTKEEVALIRQMASGGTNSQILKLLSKFDPKGPVSAILGFALGGPVLPIAGWQAAKMRESGMEKAAQRLLFSAASGRGTPPIVPRQAARNVVPLIPAALPAANAAEREFEIKRQLRSLTGG